MTTPFCRKETGDTCRRPAPPAYAGLASRLPPSRLSSAATMSDHAGRLSTTPFHSARAASYRISRRRRRAIEPTVKTSAIDPNGSTCPSSSSRTSWALGSTAMCRYALAADFCDSSTFRSSRGSRREHGPNPCTPDAEGILFNRGLTTFSRGVTRRSHSQRRGGRSHG